MVMLCGADTVWHLRSGAGGEGAIPHGGFGVSGIPRDFMKVSVAATDL